MSFRPLAGLGVIQLDGGEDVEMTFLVSRFRPLAGLGVIQRRIFGGGT